MVTRYETFFYSLENLEKIAAFALNGNKLFPMNKLIMEFELNDTALSKLDEELYLKSNPNDKKMFRYKKADMIEINVAGVNFRFKKELKKENNNEEIK